MLRPEDTILELREVSLYLGGLRIFEGLSGTFYPGRVNLILGENGSGKTSLLNLISGLVKINRGSVLLCGRDLTPLSPWERARLGIVRSFQEPRVFRYLRVFENTAFALRALPFTRLLPSLIFPRGRYEMEARKILAPYGLETLADQKAGELSIGQQRLVNLVKTLHTEGLVFLLDEPFAGINPALVPLLAETINRLARKAIVLVIEHSQSALEKLHARFYLLKDGRLEETV